MQPVVTVAGSSGPQLTFSLPVRFETEDGRIVAFCDPLDVVSQGDSRDSARAAITEAVSLFLEATFEMGTLEDVLRAQGFTRMQPPSLAPHGDHEMIDVPMELVANAKAATGKLPTAGSSATPIGPCSWKPSSSTRAL